MAKKAEIPPRLRYIGPEPREFPGLGRVLVPGDLIEYDDALAQLEREPGVKMFEVLEGGDG